MAQTTQQAREAAESLLAARVATVRAAAAVVDENEYEAPDTDAIARAVQAAINAMADGWTGHAIALEGAKWRGATGLQKDLRTAAGQARGFALGLDKPDVAAGVDALDGVVQTRTATPAEPAPTITDYLEGKTDVIPDATLPTLAVEATRDLMGELKASLVEAVGAGRVSTIDRGTLTVHTVPGIEGDGAMVPALSITAPPAVPPLALFAVAGPPERLTWDQIGACAAALRTHDHVSPSSIIALADCSLAWLIDHAHLNTAEVPAWWNVGGNAFHAAVERIERGVHAGELPLGIADVAGLWDATLTLHIAGEESGSQVDSTLWRTGGRGLENGAWWQVEGLAMLQRYVASHDAKWRERYVIASLADSPDHEIDGGPGVPAVELGHRLILGRTAVDLRIDQVWFDRETGRYRIVDLKSGATGQSSRLAMALYAHAWAEMASPGRTLAGPIGAAFYDARAGSHDLEIEDVRAEWPLPVVTQMSGAAMAIVEAGLYLPRISGSKGFGTCGSCTHSKICPAVMVTP